MVTPLTADEIIALPLPTEHPLEFIRKLNTGSLHRAAREKLAKATSLGNGISCVSSDGAIVILGEVLPWDSEHFGMPIAKISEILVESGDRASLKNVLSAFISYTASLGLNYIFSAIDTRNNLLIQTLGEAGFIPLEFRANYFQDLRNFSFPKRFNVRLAEERDLPSLVETALLATNPLDRFYGDPVLPKSKVDELMVKWVQNSILAGFADGALVPNSPDPQGFCTFRLNQHSWNDWGVKLAQPVLAAVSPKSSGWYVRIMSEMSYYLREQGADYAQLTTQFGNLPVIRTWEALGYTLGGSEVVMRRAV